MKKFIAIFLVFQFLLAGNLAMAKITTAADLGVGDPILLPTNPFYFLKEFGRSIRRTFTFKPAAKAELEFKILNEKAAEIEKLRELDSGNEKRLTKAIKNYQVSQERLNSVLNDIDKEAADALSDSFFDDLADKTVKHEMIFSGIKEDFKESRDIEMLIEEIDDAIEEEEDLVSDKALINFGELLEENRREASLELEMEFKELEELEKSLMEEAGDDALEEEENGRIAPEPIEAEPEEEKETEIFCTQQYDPVCGVNSKTYSNACMAKVAGVAVEYEGECGRPAEEVQPLPVVEPKAVEVKLEVDDSGFYPSPTITVPKGSKVTIHFAARATNVYFAGLEIRSAKFKTPVMKAGESASADFIADESFEFQSWWPAANYLKATGKVIVK